MFNKKNLLIASLLISFCIKADASTQLEEEQKISAIVLTNVTKEGTRAVFNSSDYEIKNSPLYQNQAAYINLPMIHPYHPCGSRFFQYFPLIAIDNSKTNFFNIQTVVAPDFEVDKNEQKQSFRPHHFIHAVGTETTNNPLAYTIYHGGEILRGEFNDTYQSHDNVASPNCSHLPPYVFVGETESILIRYKMSNCNFWTILMSDYEALEKKILNFALEKKIDQFNLVQMIEFLESEIQPIGADEFYKTLKENFQLDEFYKTLKEKFQVKETF